MALTKCPECGREVSDIAASCPNCGFPIRSHFENIRIENENRIREEKKVSFINGRKQFLQQKTEFTIFGNKISFTENQKIHISVTSHILSEAEEVHSYIKSLFFDDSDIFSYDEYSHETAQSDIHEWVHNCVYPIANAAIDAVKKFLVDGAYYKDEIEEQYIKAALQDDAPDEDDDIMSAIYGSFDSDALEDYLFDRYRDYYEEIRLDQMNVYEDVRESMTRGKTYIVDKVYANSLRGLVVSEAKAAFVNGLGLYAQERLQKGSQQRKLSEAAARIAEIDRPQIAKLLSDLDEMLYQVTLDIRKAAIKFMLERYAVINEKSYLPVGNQAKLVANVSSKAKELPLEDKEEFIHTITEWPLIIDTYAWYCSYFNLGDTAKSIRKICDFFDASDMLIESLKAPIFENEIDEDITSHSKYNTFTRLCENYESNLNEMGIALADEYLSYKKRLELSYEKARTYNGKVFETVKAKDEYIEAEKERKERERKQREEEKELKRRDREERTVDGKIYPTIADAELAKESRAKARAILKSMSNGHISLEQLQSARTSIEELNLHPKNCLENILPAFEEKYKKTEETLRTYRGIVYNTLEERNKAEQDYNFLFDGIDVLDDANIKILRERLETYPECTKQVENYASKTVKAYDTDMYIANNLGELDKDRYDEEYFSRVTQVRNAVVEKYGAHTGSKRLSDVDNYIKKANSLREVSSTKKENTIAVTFVGAVKIVLIVVLAVVLVILDFALVPTIVLKIIIGIAVIYFAKDKISDIGGDVKSSLRWNKSIQDARKKTKKR